MSLAQKTWYNLTCHSHGENAFLFLSKSRLSVTRSHDCDKHEKQQVGGYLIRGTMFKTCSKCGKVKLFTEFEKDNRLRSGLGARCKKCSYAAKRKWKDDNPEKQLESSRRWKAANPEKVREGRRQYYQQNGEKERTDAREWQLQNSDRVRESKRKWGVRESRQGLGA